MAQNNSPTVRDCEKLAKKYGYDKAILVGIDEQSQEFTVSSYGRDRAQCQLAAQIGEAIHRAVYDFYLNR